MKTVSIAAVTLCLTLLLADTASAFGCKKAGGAGLFHRRASTGAVSCGLPSTVMVQTRTVTTTTTVQGCAGTVQIQAAPGCAGAAPGAASGCGGRVGLLGRRR